MQPASWFERACRAAAALVPFGVALTHVASSPAWRADLPLLRGLAWVGNARTGGVSAILVQASFFVPFGSLYFRAALVAALALAGAGLATYGVARRLLDLGAPTPRLSAALASIAALTVTLGATGQREGTIAGGASVALLLAIVAIELAADLDRGRSLALGFCFGALVGENAVVAIAVGAGIAAPLVVGRARVDRASALWAIGAAALTALFAFLPAVVRGLSPAPFLDLGRSIGALGPASVDAPSSKFGGVGVLADEVGRVALAFALAGGVVGLARSRSRAPVSALVLLALLDWLAARVRFVSSEEVVPLHLVALACLAVGIAIAVQALAVTLLDMRLVMARETTLLLVMGNLALVAASGEEAAFSAERSASGGAQAFTDESIERVAPGAAVLVRSRAAAHRMWSARLVEGTRPDVLIEPLPLLGDTRLALGLLRAEPALQQTLRDVSLEGRPGEEALTILADARPVLVELDSRWDRRVVSHLVADHFFSRFAPEPLGPSDRRAAFADLRARLTRVLAAATNDEKVEPATAAVLSQRLADGAAEAAMLGDRDEAILLLEQLGKLSSGDRFVAELTQRLAATKSGPVDVRGLLR